jgi:hypothetical protein
MARLNKIEYFGLLKVYSDQVKELNEILERKNAISQDIREARETMEEWKNVRNDVKSKFDGKEIGSRMVSFGFWLGDEGSGAYLGKMVFRAWLKGQLKPEIEWQAEEVFGCNRPSALQAILQYPKPNARMARLGGLAIRNKQLPFFAGIIEKGLNDFFDENIDLLESAKELPFHFSGSVAFHLQEEIKALLTSRNLMPGVFADRTAEALFRYHQPLLPS